MVTSNRLFITLYTDEDVTSQLAILVRQRGFKALSTHDVGLIGASDERQLEYAAENDFVLLTFNQRDFLMLAQQWASQGKSHAGILLSNQFGRTQLGELLRLVLRFLNNVTTDEMINRVRYLSDFR